MPKTFASGHEEPRGAGSSGGPPYCPSAQPGSDGSVVLGVLSGTTENPRLAYLKEPQPVTDELLKLAGPVEPTEVFRFSAPCVGGACKHFDGADCRLARRTVQMLPAVVERPPPCRLRPRCRWWRQEGKEACARCPVIVTTISNPTDDQRLWADPSE